MNKGEAMSLIPYWNKPDYNRQSKNTCENGELAGKSKLHRNGAYWYSLGETPNCFLNATEKWAAVLNPVYTAISETLSLPSRNKTAALLSLYLRKKVPGVSPVSSFTL